MSYLRGVELINFIALLFALSLLEISDIGYKTYGNPGASFTNIYVTHGNGIVDLLGGGIAKVYVGQTPKINLTAYNPDLGLLGADLYTKLNNVASSKQYVWKGSSATWYWYWSTPASQAGTYAYVAELWWDNSGTQVLQDTKSFSILVVELKISNWRYSQTTVQRGSATPAKLTISFANGGNDDMANVKLEVIDTAGLNFQSQVSYLGSIAVAASKSSDFYVTAPATKPIGSYSVRFRVSYDDFRGVTHTEEKTATVDVVNIATRISIYHPSSITYGDTVQLTAYLYDMDNNPVPSQTIRFLSNGTQIGTAVTDSSGKATYTITSILDAGTYLLQAVFQPTENYGGSTTQPSTLLVQKMKTSVELSYVYGMKIGTETQITATLGDINGRALPGYIISFYLDDVLIGSSVTDQTGTTSIRYTPRTAGTYTLKGVFLGSKNYDSSSSIRSVVISAFSITVITPFANAPVVTVDQIAFTTNYYGSVEVQVHPGTHNVSVLEYYTISPGVRAKFVRWADGTQRTSISLDVSSDLTLSAQYKRQYLIDIVFQDATGTRTITPDSMTAVGPDGSSNTFSNYLSLWLDEGQWVISSILWRDVRIELDAYKTLSVGAPTELIVRCAVYDLKVTVQDPFGFKIPGAEVKITLPYGSTQTQMTSQTGTALFTLVPRGRFSISVTNMGFTTNLDGDASVKNDVTVIVPMSTTTVVGVIVIIGTVGGMAYIVLRKRRFQKIPPPPLS
jgi:predicted thioesterase